MIRNRSLGGLLMSVAAFAVGTSLARADLTIRDYQPFRHDRFYTGTTPPPNFIGTGFDFSGVGKTLGPTQQGNWATLISPQFAIGSRHRAASVGETIFFTIGNNAVTTNIAAQVASRDIVLNPTGAGLTTNSDLIVYRLSNPVTPSVVIYPILADLPANLNQTFFVYGQNARVGRNVLNGLVQVNDDGLGSSGIGTFFNYQNPNLGTFANPQVGGDLARLEVGDSGGPSFVAVGNQLALLGIHWFNYNANDIVGNPFNGSGDTYLPFYITQINAAITRLGGTADDLVRVVAVPEPSTLLTAGIGLGLVAVIARRRRRAV